MVKTMAASVIEAWPTLTSWTNESFTDGVTMATTSSDGSGADVSSDTFTNLLPALLQVFLIIGFGYLSGRVGLISPSQGKGLATFVSKFAMPALLFKSMCELSFDDVNWAFLGSLALGKVIIFIVTVVMTVVMTRPTHLGKVGIYGIFATQSHDFALGIPVVRALYSETRPDFEKYLYLIAPVSVAILNPIGFLLMETQRRRNMDAGSRSSCLHTLSKVLYGVLSNPIVFMTVLGICGNFIFHQKVPSSFDNILTVLGQSFAATALFCLGHSMNGKLRNIAEVGILTPVLLIAVKMLITPFVIRELVFHLTSSANATSMESFSAYGFLYGSFPTAPTVFIYAGLYNVEADLVAACMVISTFISAPFMFISGQMMTMTSSPDSYKPLINETAASLGIVTLVCCVWVWIVFAIHRRLRSVPHMFTACLVLTQAMMGVGIILHKYANHEQIWARTIQFVLFFTGVMGTRCWTGALAVGLGLLKCRSLCLVNKVKPWLFFYAFGLPILLCSLILICGEHQHQFSPDDISMEYGQPQMIVAACVLSLNILLTGLALILTNREEHRQQMLADQAAAAEAVKEEAQKALLESQHAQLPLANGVATSIARPTATSQFETRNRPICSSSAPAKVPLLSELYNIPDIAPKTKKPRRVIKGRRPKKQRAVKLTCDECTGGCGQEAAPTVVDVENLVPDTLVRRRRRNDTVSSNDSDLVEITEELANLPTTLESHAEGASDRLRLIPASPGDMPQTVSSRCPAVVVRPVGGDIERGDDDFAACKDATCPSETVKQCQMLETFGSNQLERTLLDEEMGSIQPTRHLVLLLILLASCFVGLCLCLWKLLKEETSIIFVEIEFLDCALTYGQGFFTFAIFGLDSVIIIEPIVKSIQWCFTGGRRRLMLRPWGELEEMTRLVCEQFIRYHKAQCHQAIVKVCCRQSLRTYRNVFIGTEFVDWLLEVGLASDRSEAVLYGGRLLDGRVLQHVHQEHHFRDLPYFYEFVEVRSNNVQETTSPETID